MRIYKLIVYTFIFSFCFSNLIFPNYKIIEKPIIAITNNNIAIPKKTKIILKIKPGFQINSLKILNDKYIKKDKNSDKASIKKLSEDGQDIENIINKAKSLAMSAKIKGKTKEQNDYNIVVQNLEQRKKRIPENVKVPDISNIYVLELKENQDINLILNEYKNNPAIEYVEEDKIARAFHLPNDYWVDYDQDNAWNKNMQVYYSNWTFENLWGLKNINMEYIWDNSQMFYPTDNTKIKLGTSIIVAVIDTGVMANKTDMNSTNVLTTLGKDWVNNDMDPSDDNGHGTHVAGIIAAKGNNAFDIIGVAASANILALKVLNASGIGDLSDIAAAIIYAADNGAQIINLSLGGAGSSQALTDAINYAYGKGCVIIAAAGNDNNNVENYTPANINKVITVAAIDHLDVKSNFSNYGSKIAVCAPGGSTVGGSLEFIISLHYASDTGNVLLMAGTSQACPHVAGMAALILANRPHITNEDLYKIITANVIDLGTAGKDDYYGYGKIYIAKISEIFGPQISSVTDEGNYTTSNVTLNATWDLLDASANVTEYYYAIGTTPNATNIVDWTSTILEKGVTRNSLSLTNGSTYYFSVKAKDNAGVFSPIVTSNGIIIDSIVPSLSVTDEGAYTTSNSTLSASWQDLATANVAEYQYAIGTAIGREDIVSWNAVGTAKTVTKTGLTLVNGQTYYFSVKAATISGLLTGTAYSNGITIDSIVPSLSVTDEGIYTTRNSTLSASWQDLATANIAEYQYAIGTNPGEENVVSWNSVGIVNSIVKTNLSLLNKHTYYFSVRGITFGGQISSTAYSDGIMVDAIVPSLSVTDEGIYTTRNSTLSASWQDLATTIIKQYEYAIGTDMGREDVVSWNAVGMAGSVTKTALNLVNGQTYYFSVRASTVSGFHTSTAYSNGIIIDAIVPSLSVTDEGVYTTSNSSLSASWQDLATSSIKQYEYAIGTAIGREDIVSWNAVGTASSVTKTGLSLLNGKKYYFSIKATTISDLLHSTAYSDGIQIYLSVPSINITPIISTDSITNKEKSAIVKINVDSIENIKSYKIIVYRKKDNTIFSESSTVNINENFNTAKYKVLSQNTLEIDIKDLLPLYIDCYVKIIVLDIAGNTTEVKTDTINLIEEKETFEVTDTILYPNPFNPLSQKAKIKFIVSKTSIVNLYIHAINGQLLYSINENFVLGQKILYWNGYDNWGNLVANGVYFAYLIIEELNNKNNKFKKMFKIAVLK